MSWLKRSIRDLEASGDTAGLVQALGHRNAEDRARAAAALGRSQRPYVVGPLVTALADREGLVRKAAAEALGKLGDQRAVEPLIGALQEDGVVLSSAAAAAEALGLLGDRRAIVPLMAALDRDQPNLQIASARALGVLGDRRAVGTLIVALFSKIQTVRLEAIKALGTLGDKRAAPALADAIRTDDPTVRTSAVNSLVLLGAPAVAPLVALLQVDDRETRLAAVAALGRLGAPAVAPLLALLQVDDRETRLAAVAALGRLGDRRAVEPLIGMLASDDWDEWSAACDALVRIADLAAAPPLIAALGTYDRRRMKSALKALSALRYTPGRDVGDVGYWIAALTVGEADHRGKAVEALAHMGAPAVDPVAKVLTSRFVDSDVLGAAATALQRSGDANAAKELLDALNNHPRAEVREAATSRLQFLAASLSGDAAEIESVVKTATHIRSLLGDALQHTDPELWETVACAGCASDQYTNWGNDVSCCGGSGFITSSRGSNPRYDELQRQIFLLDCLGAALGRKSLS